MHNKTIKIVYNINANDVYTILKTKKESIKKEWKDYFLLIKKILL